VNHDVLWYVGAIIAVSVALGLLTAVAIGCLRVVVFELDRLREQGRDAWMDWSKQKLRTASWWFSEDMPTRELLADLAEITEWDAREKWRARRKLPAAPSASQPTQKGTA